MSVITLKLLLTLFGCSHALKIAMGEMNNQIVGTGSGSGSQGTDVSSIVDDSDAEVDGEAKSFTATNSEGEDVPGKIKKFSFTAFSEATAPITQTAAGGEVKIPATALKEIAALATDGATLSLTISKGTSGTVPTEASACDPYEVTISQTSGGVTSEVDVKGLSVPIEIDIGSCSADTCAFWDETALTWSTTGASGTPPKCKYTHLTLAGGISKSGVSGDPKAMNMAGQKFEILAMGTFQLLSIASFQNLDQKSNKLTLDATIDRAGEMCGATYIKNVSMTGSWIQEFDGLTSLQIRAAADVSKNRALQVSMDSNKWEESRDVKVRSMIKKASAKQLELLIHSVTIETKIDAHRIRKNGAKTNMFANFLNVNVKGLKEAKKEKVRMGGLLAYDDHTFAMQAPDGCKPGKLANLKQKLDSVDMESQMTFLSSVDVQ